MPRLDAINARTARDFHHAADCARTATAGPRGGITIPREQYGEWRRNGATQTWKTRPTEYRIPVKYGMRSYDSLTQHDGMPYGPWHVGRSDACELGTLRDSLALAVEHAAFRRDGAR